MQKSEIMEITLKNVNKKDLPVLKALAKRLGFEICIQEDKTTKIESK